MNQVFEPVNLRKKDPEKLTDNINEFISRIRKNNSIGVREADSMLKDVAWITDKYSEYIDSDKRETLKNGSKNVVLGLDSTKAVLLLQVTREAIKPAKEGKEVICR
jgi:hypothetical protein